MKIEEIIQRFIKDQTYVIEKLYAHYGVDRTITANEWVFLGRELKRKCKESPIAEVFRIHGCGLEFKNEHVHIDYDYADSGRANGFDAWRLFHYAEDNRVSCDYTSDRDIDAELKRRHLAGSLDTEGRFYFLPLAR